MRAGCLCGGVRFEVSEPLGRAGYCHCTRCQHTDSAAAWEPVPDDGLERLGASVWPSAGQGNM